MELVRYTARPVQHARRHRRFFAWIALVAMIAFALMPSVSRALAHAAGNDGTAGLVEVCTPQGARLIVADAAGESQDGGETVYHALDHCAFCGLAAEGAAPLRAASPTLPLPLQSAEPPVLFLRAAHTLHAWRSAQPRAPPLVS